MNTDALNQFHSVAAKAASKSISVSFAENESGLLSFHVVPANGLDEAAIAQIFGSVLPAIRKGLKALGYTVHAKPEILDGEVSFLLSQSPFAGKLADLSEGWSTPEAFIAEARDILSGEVSKSDLLRVLSLIQAVDSYGLSKHTAAVAEEVSFA